MFGNVLNNAQVRRLVDDRFLTILPFDPHRLRLCHYSLRPAGILRPEERDANNRLLFTTRHDFRNGDEYVFGPNEYAIVEVEERIVLCPGLIGRFVPGSYLIDS